MSDWFRPIWNVFSGNIMGIPPQPAPAAGPPVPPQGAPPGSPVAAALAANPPTDFPVSPVPPQGAPPGSPVAAALAGDSSTGLPVPPVPPGYAPGTGNALPNGGWTGTSPTAPTPASAGSPPAATSSPFGAGWDLVNNNRNNPLNIRFIGQPGATNINGFASWQTPQAGLQATQALFGSYAKQGINTLSGLISKWAPPSENDTAGYIQKVSAATGLDPNAPIDLTDPSVQQRVMGAMSRVENGGAMPSNLAMGSTSTPPGADSKQQGQVGGPLDTNAIMSLIHGAQPDMNAMRQAMQVGIQPSTTSDKLLAIGAGLLSGHSFADGLSKAAANVLQLRQMDRANAMKGGELEAQLQSLGLRGDQMAVSALLASGRLGVQNGRLQLAEGNSQFAHQGGALGLKDNNEDFNYMNDEGRQALSLLPQIDALNQEIQHTATGPDQLSRFKRFMATQLGVDVGSNPTFTQLANTYAAMIRNGQVAGSMRGLGLRSNNEFNTFKQGMISLDTLGPKALPVVLDQMRRMAQFHAQNYSDFYAMPEDQRRQILGNPYAFSSWYEPRYLSYAQRSQGVTPQVGAPPSQPLVTTPNGPALRPPLDSFWNK